MFKFIKTHNLPGLNQQDIEGLNTQITNKDSNVVIKYLTIKAQTDEFMVEFYQRFKEELIPIPLFLSVY
jgi:hypothetical protein